MSAFRTLSDSVSASPQITVADVERAKAQGFTQIICNRPDGESPDQTNAADIEAAAAAAGLGFTHIPVGSGGFSMPQVDAMQAAITEASGKVLAYCRSGTRSTFLWALARAKAGDNPSGIAARAADAGYDVSPIRQTMDMLAAGN